MRPSLFPISLLLILIGCTLPYDEDHDGEAVRTHASTPETWSSYGGAPGGSRYAALTQINRDNVQDLQVAWTFSAAGMDDFIRAFDIDTGDEVWKASLPAGGQATPMTYEIDGKQYLVLAAGGHGNLGTTLGAYIVAFALP